MLFLKDFFLQRQYLASDGKQKFVFQQDKNLDHIVNNSGLYPKTCDQYSLRYKQIFNNDIGFYPQHYSFEYIINFRAV